MPIQWKSSRGVRWIDGDCPLFDVEHSLYNVIHAKTALIAKINYRYYGMFISADHQHAEEKFIASFNLHKQVMIDDGLLKRDHPNLLSIQLTHSPCGKRDGRRGSCGEDLANFYRGSFKTNQGDILRIKVFDIYGGVRYQAKPTRKGMTHVGTVQVNDGQQNHTLNVLLDTHHLGALTRLREAGIHVRAWNVKEKLDENQYRFKEYEVLTKRMKLRKVFRMTGRYGYDEDGDLLTTGGEKATSAASVKWHLDNLAANYDHTRQGLILAGFSTKTKWSDIPGATLTPQALAAHIPLNVTAEDYPESDIEIEDDVMQ